MKPDELHGTHITAIITGDLEAAAKLRAQFRAQDHGFAAEYLRAATAVCLEYRFGPGAGIGAGPIDYDRLRAFTSELRRAGRNTAPPSDYLAVEAVTRALYGEPHLAEPLNEQRRSQAHYTVLEYELSHHPWLRRNPGHLAERAKARMTAWVLGGPGA
jgi:hypothetical protein